MFLPRCALYELSQGSLRFVERQSLRVPLIPGVTLKPHAIPLTTVSTISSFLEGRVNLEDSIREAGAGERGNDKDRRLCVSLRIGFSRAARRERVEARRALRAPLSVVARYARRTTSIRQIEILLVEEARVQFAFASRAKLRSARIRRDGFGALTVARETRGTYIGGNVREFLETRARVSAAAPRLTAFASCFTM